MCFFKYTNLLIRFKWHCISQGLHLNLLLPNNSFLFCCNVSSKRNLGNHVFPRFPCFPKGETETWKGGVTFLRPPELMGLEANVLFHRTDCFNWVPEAPGDDVCASCVTKIPSPKMYKILSELTPLCGGEGLFSSTIL